MNHIKWLVNRLHVSTSDRAVIREIRNHIKPEYRSARTNRRVRHGFYREALETHHNNQGLYQLVTRGHL